MNSIAAFRFGGRNDTAEEDDDEEEEAEEDERDEEFVEVIEISAGDVVSSVQCPFSVGVVVAVVVVALFLAELPSSFLLPLLLPLSSVLILEVMSR